MIYHIASIQQLQTFVKTVVDKNPQMDLDQLVAKARFHPVFDAWGAYQREPKLFENDTFYTFSILCGFYEKQSITALFDDIKVGKWRMTTCVPPRLLEQWAEELQLSNSNTYYPQLMEQTWKASFSGKYFPNSNEALAWGNGVHRRLWTMPHSMLQLVQQYIEYPFTQEECLADDLYLLKPETVNSNDMLWTIFSDELAQVYKTTSDRRGEVLVDKTFSRLFSMLGWNTTFEAFKQLCVVAKTMDMGYSTLSRCLYDQLQLHSSLYMDFKDMQFPVVEALASY